MHRDINNRVTVCRWFDRKRFRPDTVKVTRPKRSWHIMAVQSSVIIYFRWKTRNNDARGHRNQYRYATRFVAAAFLASRSGRAAAVKPISHIRQDTILYSSMLNGCAMRFTASADIEYVSRRNTYLYKWIKWNIKKIL